MWVIGGVPKEVNHEEKGSLPPAPNDKWMGRWEWKGLKHMALFWIEKKSNGGTKKRKHTSCIFSQ